MRQVAMSCKAREPAHQAADHGQGGQSSMVVPGAAEDWLALEIARYSYNFLCLQQGGGPRAGMWLQMYSSQGNCL